MVEVLHQQQLAGGQAVAMAVRHRVVELKRSHVGRVVAGGRGVDREGAVAVVGEPIAQLGAEATHRQGIAVGVVEALGEQGRAEGEGLAGQGARQHGGGGTHRRLVDRLAEHGQGDLAEAEIPVGDEIRPLGLDRITAAEELHRLADVGVALHQHRERGGARQLRMQRHQIAGAGKVHGLPVGGPLQQQGGERRTGGIGAVGAVGGIGDGGGAEDRHLHLQLGQRQGGGGVAHAALEDLERIRAQQVRHRRRHLQGRTDLLHRRVRRLPLVDGAHQQGGERGVHRRRHRTPHIHQAQHRFAVAPGGEHQQAAAAVALGMAIGVAVADLGGEGVVGIPLLHHVAELRGALDLLAVAEPLHRLIAAEAVGVGERGLHRGPLRHRTVEGLSPAIGEHHHPGVVHGRGRRRSGHHRHQRGGTGRAEGEQAVAELQLLHAHQHVDPFPLAAGVHRDGATEGIHAQGIGRARAAVHGRVEVGAAVEKVVAAISLELVVARACENRVVAGAGHHDVGPTTGVNRVVAGLEVEVFVLGAAGADVVTGAATAGIGHHPGARIAAGGKVGDEQAAVENVIAGVGDGDLDRVRALAGLERRHDAQAAAHAVVFDRQDAGAVVLEVARRQVGADHTEGMEGVVVEQGVIHPIHHHHAAIHEGIHPLRIFIGSE